MGDTENEENHDLELEKLGGWDSVDESWTSAIRDGLSELWLGTLIFLACPHGSMVRIT